MDIIAVLFQPILGPDPDRSADDNRLPVCRVGVKLAVT